MTSQPEDAAAAGQDSVKAILSQLNPSEIEVDSLGRIVLKSAELRNALRNAAAQARREETTADSPTNGSQCGCFNHSGCRPVV